MAQNTPGRHYGKDISLVKLVEMFPDDATAEDWFVKNRWPDGVRCAYCECDNINTSQHPTMPFRCRDCDKFFSAKTNTIMHNSKLGCQAWAIAIYQMTTDLINVSSMKLSRDLGITQKSAWYMLHRIREAWNEDQSLFNGEVDVDETYVGGKEADKLVSKKLCARCGTVDKTSVIGMKVGEAEEVRVRVIASTNLETLPGLVVENTTEDTVVYTNEAGAFLGLPRPHQTIKQKVDEYVREQANTHGMALFWSLLKRGFAGTFQLGSRKHLHRYVTEFAGRRYARPLDTAVQMEETLCGIVGRRQKFEELINSDWSMVNRRQYCGTY